MLCFLVVFMFSALDCCLLATSLTIDRRAATHLPPGNLRDYSMTVENIGSPYHNYIINQKESSGCIPHTLPARILTTTHGTARPSISLGSSYLQQFDKQLINWD